MLHVEQLLTTGGGWQDQIGGTIGGCKRGYSFSQTELHVHVENINLHERYQFNIFHYYFLMIINVHY